MKTDFLLAITQLAAERNLPKEVVFSAVEKALASAFKKDDSSAQQNISVKIHPVSGDVKVYTVKTVVEDPTDPDLEISLAQAQKIRGDAQLGETVAQESNAFQGGRIAAQTAKQVVLQRLREAEREFIFGEYIEREDDIVGGIINRIEPRQIVVDLGKTEGILPASEQVRTERYRVGQRLKLYLLEVNRTSRGPRLILSRSHPSLVRRLFELEVPEIHNGIVELKGVAREPGYRSKVAVAARQEGIDAVGSCVGLRGVRIQNVVNELEGERIDVIQWDPEIKDFIGNALSPAQVLSVEVDQTSNTAIVVVPDGQLSLAIGKEGQNARLAARLTGFRIDIKSASVVKADKLARAGEEAEKAPPTKEPADAEKRSAVSIPVEQYDMPLEKLGLSTRVLNFLGAGGVTKVGELFEKSDKELLSIKNFGQKSLAEVRERLEALDLGAQAPAEEKVELPPAEADVEVGQELEPAAIEEPEEEVVLYVPPPVQVPATDKPLIRFKEDIFAPQEPRSDVGKKGKKKKNVEADSEAVAAANWRKGQDVVPQPEPDDDASG
ncbi:MAG: transcription termination factor NusA [Dehalococcoidia bacterium]